MAFTEDLTDFLADFGELVTLDGVSVTAIVDLDYAVSGVGPHGMSSAAPALTLPTASVPATPVGKAVVARGVNYTVAEDRPDGTGMSVLLLEAA